MFQPEEWDAKHLRLAIEAAGVALWSWNVDTDRLTLDHRAYDLWGVPKSIDVTFDDLSSHIHPVDRDRVRAAFAATRAVLGAYEVVFVSSLVTRCVGYRLAVRGMMRE
jgi:PAS domain-containing protein